MGCWDENVQNLSVLTQTFGQIPKKDHPLVVHNAIWVRDKWEGRRVDGRKLGFQFIFHRAVKAVGFGRKVMEVLVNTPG